jgi:hypothetical protein
MNKLWPAPPGVAFCQFDHCGIGAAAAHEALSRRLAERQAKRDSRHRADQRLVQVFDRFDEVCLPEDEVDCLGLLDSDAREFRGWSGCLRL